LAHVAAVAPLLAYVAYVGYNEEVLDMTFVWVLFIITIALVAWHWYLYYERNFANKHEETTNESGQVVLGEQ